MGPCWLYDIPYCSVTVAGQMSWGFITARCESPVETYSLLCGRAAQPAPWRSRMVRDSLCYVVAFRRARHALPYHAIPCHAIYQTRTERFGGTTSHCCSSALAIPASHAFPYPRGPLGGERAPLTRHGGSGWAKGSTRSRIREEFGRAPRAETPPMDQGQGASIITNTSHRLRVLALF